MMRALLVTCFAVFLGFSSAHAQLTGTTERLILSVEPRYPSPGDVVQLKLQSYAIDLDRAQIEWRANGTLIAEGNGVARAEVHAGVLGSATAISVRVQDVEGLVAEAEAIIIPAEIDLLWESTAYVPPFYAGRALPGAGSPIRVQALVRFREGNGALVQEGDIVYEWYRNDTRLTLSGRGKSSGIISGPPLFGADTITVRASSVDSRFAGEASVVLRGADATLTLYERHPLFGILYHRSLEGSVLTQETEQTVSAVPYFASITEPRQASLVYEWRVNNTPILPHTESPENLTLTTNGFSGPARIELTLMNAADYFMRAVGAWELVFGENSGAFFQNSNPFEASN